MMKKRKLMIMVSLLLCLVLGISGLSVGIVKAVEKNDFELELSESNQVILEGNGSETVTSEDEALQYFTDHADNFGIENPEETLVAQETDEVLGYKYYTFRQSYNDIPVFGNCLNLMTDSDDGTVLMSTGTYRNIDENIDLTVAATEEQIISSIEEKIKSYEDCTTITAVSLEESALDSQNLVIYEDDAENVCLAYEIDTEIRAEDEYFNYHILADAKTGDVLDGWSNIKTETVSALNEEGNYTDIGIAYEEQAQLYQLYDEERNICILDFNKANSLDDIEGTIVYGDNYIVRSQDKQSWDKKAVQLMNNVQKTYDTYEMLFGIKGWDNKNTLMYAGYNDSFDGGMNAYSYTEFDKKLENNLPFPTVISFGYNKNLIIIDLTAHEYSHSVMNSLNYYNIGTKLKYSGESGAIMEANSDVMAEIVEGFVKGHTDWLHGKGADLNNSDAVGRNLKNPHESGNPKKIGDKYYGSTINFYNDNGNVHKNSTILSYASYLMVGAVETEEIEALNNVQLAYLWYLTISNITKVNIDFDEFGALMYETAQNMAKTGMLNSKQVECVYEALSTVGICVETNLINVNKSFTASVKDVYGNALDSANVQIYEIEKDKKAETGWSFKSSKPVYEATLNKAASFKPDNLQVNSYYAIKITDSKYSDEEEYYVYIRCKSKCETKKIDIATVFRKDVITDFALNDDEIDLAVDEIKYVESIVKPTGFYQNNYEIEWSSSDSDIVSIDKFGDMKGISQGTATITAKLVNKVGKKTNTFTDTVTVNVTKKQRDTVLVLDCSGSMYGTPLSEMKKSAIKFCEAIVNGGDNYVEIVSFGSTVNKSGFKNNLNDLTSYINKMTDDGGTNLYSALNTADKELKNSERKNSIKSIVVMTDGAPCDGTTQETGVMSNWASSNEDSSHYNSYNSLVKYGNAVCSLADSLKFDYSIYSLGFFHTLTDRSKAYCSYLVDYIDNCGYYEVVDSDNLEISFGDISGEVSNGSKVVITIACPVDVTVSFNGETLSSSKAKYNGNASFGTLKKTGVANDIKVLELDSSNDYEIAFEGTGTGSMDYSITYYAEDDSVEETRKFSSVPVLATSKMTSSTAKNADTELKIDSDGDGQVDSIWTANASSDGKETFKDENAVTAKVTASALDIEDKVLNPESPDDNKTVWIVLIICSSIISLSSIAALFVIALKKIPEEKSEEKSEEKNDNANTENIKAAYGVIVLSEGSLNGKQIYLETGKVHNIGKSSAQADIVVDMSFQSVSRLHCAIEFDERHNGYYITDYSSNGTFLFNSQKRLEKGKRILLARNTVIYLAQKDCRIELK